MKELCGDIKLSRAEQVWYLLYNFLRGLWGYRTFLKTRFWSSKNLSYNTDSPGRQYLNAFLKEEIPKLLPHKNITVLDIGCGNGYVRSFLEELGYKGKYVGVDVYRPQTFSNESNAFDVSFIESSIEKFKFPTTFDFVISNTSFEHIPDDFVAAKQATVYTNVQGVQMHIVPTFWCLPLYLLHGYRQYTPMRIKKIFAAKSNVYRIGGLFSFCVHFFLITIPEMLTRKRFVIRKTRFYPKIIKYAYFIDKILPIMPLFYIVVIHSPHRYEK